MSTPIFYNPNCRHPEEWEVIAVVAAVNFVSSLGLDVIADGRFEFKDILWAVGQSVATFIVGLGLEDVLEPETNVQRIVTVLIAGALIEAAVITIEEGHFKQHMVGPLLTSVVVNLLIVLAIFEVLGWCIADVEV